MTSHRSVKGKPRRCTYHGKLGYIKKFCREHKADQKEKKEKPKAATTTTRKDSDSRSSGLIASHALSVSSSSEQGTWVVDSGATCHMCHDSKWFTTLNQLQDPVDVVLGDGRALTTTGKGKVELDIILPNGESKSCTLHSVLYVPKLSYNLIT